MHRMRLFTIAGALIASTALMAGCASTPKPSDGSPPPTIAEKIAPYCTGFDVAAAGFDGLVKANIVKLDDEGVKWKNRVVTFVHTTCEHPPANMSVAEIVKAIIAHTDALQDYMNGTLLKASIEIAPQLEFRVLTYEFVPAPPEIYQV